MIAPATQPELSIISNFSFSSLFSIFQSYPLVFSIRYLLLPPLVQPFTFFSLYFFLLYLSSGCMGKFCFLVRATFQCSDSSILFHSSQLFSTSCKPLPFLHPLLLPFPLWRTSVCLSYLFLLSFYYFSLANNTSLFLFILKVLQNGKGGGGVSGINR